MNWKTRSLSADLITGLALSSVLLGYSHIPASAQTVPTSPGSMMQHSGASNCGMQSSAMSGGAMAQGGAMKSPAGAMAHGDAMSGGAMAQGDAMKSPAGAMGDAMSGGAMASGAASGEMASGRMNGCNAPGATPSGAMPNSTGSR